MGKNCPNKLLAAILNFHLNIFYNAELMITFAYHPDAYVDLSFYTRRIHPVPFGAGLFFDHRS